MAVFTFHSGSLVFAKINPFLIFAPPWQDIGIGEGWLEGQLEFFMF
jgi:hypothetical protein